MARKRYRPEEMAGTLRQAEVLRGQGDFDGERDSPVGNQRGHVLPLA